MNKKELKVIEDYANTFMLKGARFSPTFQKDAILFKKKMMDMFSKDPIDWNTSFAEFDDFLRTNNGSGKDFKTILFNFCTDRFEKTKQSTLSSKVFNVIKDKGFVEHCNALNMNDCLETNRGSYVLNMDHALFKEMLFLKVDFTLNPFANINHEIERLYIDSEYTPGNVQHFLDHSAPTKNLYEALHNIKDKVHPVIYERHIIGVASIFKSSPLKFEKFYNEFKPDLDKKIIVKNRALWSLKDVICKMNTPDTIMDFSQFFQNNNVKFDKKQKAMIMESLRFLGNDERAESTMLKLDLFLESQSSNRQYKKLPTPTL